MSTRASRPIAGLVFLLLLAFAGTAQAWVETVVRSHEARVEVARDGSAVVRHQLVLKVRGGPMKSVEIGGMGTDIEPLPDASVKSAAEGSSGMWPLLVSSLEDGSIRLGIVAEQGIRGGSYLFSFSYSLKLQEQGWIVPEPGGALVSWVGPRLNSGVDSAKVTFVIPHGTNPPQLASPESGAGASVLLGEVRQGANFDEVDLVRAHLATGEPALWRILVSSDALQLDAPALKGSQLAPELSGGSSNIRGRTVRGSEQHGLLALFLGLGFGVLVFVKARSVDSYAQTRDAKTKPLVPATPIWRASLAALFLGCASWFALEQEPWVTVVLGSLALAMATFLLPVRIVRPRGPGNWEKVEGARASARLQVPRDWFDTRQLRGFFLFVSLMGAIVATAYRLLPISNYFSLMTMALAAPLVPLFWTGRQRDFPQDPLEQAKPWLQTLSRALDSRVVRVELWGRNTAATGGLGPATHFDEARLRMVLTPSPSGLRAFEISLEEAAGACVLPCVILRVLEDSQTACRLPSTIKWQRGRSSEERVALLRPTAPTNAQLLRLVRTLVGTLRAVDYDLKKSAAKSSGSSELASKGGTPLAAAAM